MSYILDALNKSEQERQQREHGISLQPLTGVPHPSNSGPRWMPIVAVAIVLAAVGIFAAVYFSMKSAAPSAGPVSLAAPQPSAVPVPQPAARPVISAPAQPAAATDHKPAAVAVAPADKPSASAVAAPAPAPSAPSPAAQTSGAATTTAATVPAATRSGTSESVKSLYQRKGMPAEQAMAQSAADAQTRAAPPISGNSVAGDTVKDAAAVKTFNNDAPATVQTQDAVQQEQPEPQSRINHKALDAEVARQREADLAARVQKELDEMQAQDAAAAARLAQSQPKVEAKAATRPVPAKPAPAVDPDADLPLATQLSSDIQKRIPNIDFGAHVYAGRTNSGFVILNGKKRYAGDSVAPGLTVERITESGVILDLSGTRFRLNSMSSWIN